MSPIADKLDTQPGDQEVEYRITFTIERRLSGEDDFSEIGFGSSGAWESPAQASHILNSDVQNWQWEAEGNMPDPESVRAQHEVAL